jgi:NADPH-dependent F420 reductase
VDPLDLTVGLIGGTGPEGRALALRWAKAGARVTIGSRSLERAKLAADQLNRMLAGTRVSFAENKEVASSSDFIILTVPFEHAASTIESLRESFKPGAILIDATVPVAFQRGRARYIELPEGSASEHLSARLGDSVQLVAAFKTLPAQLLLETDAPIDCDDFIASDHEQAKSIVIESASRIHGLRPLDAGPLQSARIIERMTVLAININRRYRIKTARFKIVGL